MTDAELAAIVVALATLARRPDDTASPPPPASRWRAAGRSYGDDA